MFLLLYLLRIDETGDNTDDPETKETSYAGNKTEQKKKKKIRFNSISINVLFAEMEVPVGKRKMVKIEMHRSPRLARVPLEDHGS